MNFLRLCFSTFWIGCTEVQQSSRHHGAAPNFPLGLHTSSRGHSATNRGRWGGACAEWAVIEKLPADILCPGAPTTCKETAKLMQKRAVAVKSTREWSVGTVHVMEKSKNNAGKFSIKVKGMQGWIICDLRRDNYGRDKEWVLLKKALSQDNSARRCARR